VLKPNKYGGDVGLVKEREGLVLRWYRDSLGKWTGGYGHLRKPGEESLTITPALAEKWLSEDIRIARDAAKRQFDVLPIQTENLLDTLVSVNFQLGTAWTAIHKKTWALMVAGKYPEAAQEAKNSIWYTQTPVRVEDLSYALYEAHRLGAEYDAL